MLNNNLYINERSSELIALGFVYSAYGIKGAIKVKAYSKQAEVLLTVNKWGLACLEENYIFNNMTVKFFTVINSYLYKDYVIAYLSGINDRNLSEKLKSYKIYVQRDLFPIVNTDEYYYIDLIGCDFYGIFENKVLKIGVVNDILDNNAHPILKINIEENICHDKKVINNTNVLNKKNNNIEILVPFVKAHIEQVDLKNHIIISNWSID